MSATTDLINIIKEEPGIMIVDLIDDEIKKQVLQHEMKRLEELVPFINKGMEEALNEENAIAIVINNDEKIYHKVEDSNSSFTLQTESGQIIGETITDEEELEELREDPSVYFLSENFVTYNNLAKPGEKQFFVMSSASSSFLTDKNLEDYVSSLKLAIPSTGTDNYLKDLYNIPHSERIGTFIIGFTE